MTVKIDKLKGIYIKNDLTKGFAHNVVAKWIFLNLFTVIKIIRNTVPNVKNIFTNNIRRVSSMSLYDVMSSSEAEERWGLPTGAVRQSIHRGKLKGHSGVRKSGNTWLITIDAMKEIYGEPKMKEETK